MKTLINTIGWDLKLQLKYQIITVATVVTFLYLGLFYLSPMEGLEKLLIMLIFSDPAMLGFMFIGVLVLFEKGTNTLSAILVTPLKPGTYIWSKAISLTVIALIAGVVMAIGGHGIHLHFHWLIIGIIEASFIALLIGFIGVSRVRTLNQYMMIIPFFLTPLVIPVLNFFDLTNNYFLYLIPTQAPLLLFEAAFGEKISTWQIIYSIIYPAVSIRALHKWSVYCFKKYIIEKSV